MQHRRLLVPLALAGSFGIALAPTFASAASTTSHAASAAGLSASAKSAAKIFSSPLSKSVFSRHGVSAHTSAPNPDLEVGVAALQTSAYGVEFVVMVSGLNTGSATLTINWGDETTKTVTVDSDTDGLDFTHEYSGAGTYPIYVTLADGSGDTATNNVDFETMGSDYTPFGPFRILDTRTSSGAVKAGGTLKLKVTGKGGNGVTIPDNATAVALNVTATQTNASGVLTAYNDEDSYGDSVDRPSTSNLNWGKGQTVANVVVLPVGANGEVDFYNNSKGTTQVVVDTAGYYTASVADTYQSVTPTRILDTRKGTGTGKIAKVAADGSVTLTIAGQGLVPAGASAVQLNITAVDGTSSGFITADPGDGTSTASSNLNYGPGQTVANSAVVAFGDLNTDIDEITLHNTSKGTVDLIADVSGYYEPTASGGSAYIPLPAPVRLYDSRQKNDVFTGPLSVGKPVAFPITSDTLETAFVLNATVTDTTGNGYLGLYPYNPNDPTAQPGTSTLNYLKGQTIPNLAVETAGTVYDSVQGSYDLGVYLGGKGTGQVVLDAFGFFADQ